MNLFSASFPPLYLSLNFSTLASQVLLILFAVVVAIQLVYLLAFVISFARIRMQKNEQTFPTSIIVCAHDEETNLKALIPLLLAQDYPQFEVIIVDDRSNDNTFDLLLEETKKDHRLRMVHVNRTPPHVNSKKYSLTLGIKAAKYEWLLLTDADCRPKNNQWIKAMSQGFQDKNKFVLGYSPYLGKAGLLNVLIRFETIIAALQYISFAWMGSPYMGVGRNLAYRRSFFLEVKGFNNFLNVTGGDDDLFVNQHAKGSTTAVAIGTDALMQSIPQITWSSFFKQKIRHLSVGKFYKFKHRSLLGLFMLTWLLTWFVGIPLATMSPYIYWIVGALAFRVILLAVATLIAVKKFGEQFQVWKVPFLDFIFSFYYLSTGLIALVSKKVRWKN